MTRRSPGSPLIVWGVALSGALTWAGVVAASGVALDRPGSEQASSAAQAGPPQATSQTPPLSAPSSSSPHTQAVGPSRPGPCGPPWSWWRDQTFTKDISLRPSQAAEIDRLYTRRLRDMDTVIKEYGQERAGLDRMIADRVVDSSVVDLQATMVNAHWSQLNSSEIVMRYRMSKVLDLDQFAKLRAREAAATCTSPNNPGRNEEWWKDEAIKKETGLLPKQAHEIDDYYARRLKDMEPFVEAYSQQRTLLEKMEADRVADDITFNSQVDNVNALRSKLRSSRTLMLYRISKVLDADQYAKLKAIFEHQLAQRRGGGGTGLSPAQAPRALPR